MKFALLFAFTLIANSFSWAQNNGIHYEGRMELTELVVLNKNNQRIKYTVNAINPSMPEEGTLFHLFPEGGLTVGMVTRCPPFLGTLGEDLLIKARFDEVYKLVGEFEDRKNRFGDMELSQEKKKSGQLGQGSLTVPKGSVVYGTCSRESKQTLIEVTFIPPEGLNIKVKMSRCPDLAPEDYHLSSDSCMFLQD